MMTVQKLMRTSQALHQCSAVSFTIWAVILKESKKQRPQQNSLTHLKTITEQIIPDQIIDLSNEQLAGVTGGYQDQKLWEKCQRTTS